MKKYTFTLLNDVKIYEDNDIFTLKKGYLNSSELTVKIDLKNPILELFREKKITITSNNENFEDVKKLFNFGFLNYETTEKYATLVIWDKRIKELIIPFLEKNHLFNNLEIINLFEFLSENDIEILSENRNRMKIDAIFKKINTKIGENCFLTHINSSGNILKSRVINQYALWRDQEYTLCLIDNDNIYLTHIIPKLSGCYGCMEKKISAKFNMTTSDLTVSRLIENSKDTILQSNDMNNIQIALGLLFRHLSDLYLYGSTVLSGNVLHYYLPLFEYSFDFNRRTVMCDCCAIENEIDFEEQNMRSINILKQIEGEK